MVMMLGKPRNASVYKVASKRIGCPARPGIIRAIATNSAQTRIKTSAIQKITTLVMKAFKTKPNLSTIKDILKNVLPTATSLVIKNQTASAVKTAKTPYPSANQLEL